MRLIRLAAAEMIWRSWLRQGMLLAALFCVAMAVGRLLDRYHLVIDGHSPVVAGGSFADVYFWLPAYDVIIGSWSAAALVLATAAWVPGFRSWLLLRPSRWLVPCGLFAIPYYLRGRCPAGC